MYIHTYVDEAEQLEEEQQERLAEIDEEDPPEIEEELEEEDESEATDRMKASLSEQYQECVEQISQIQVLVCFHYLHNFSNAIANSMFALVHIPTGCLCVNKHI